MLAPLLLIATAPQAYVPPIAGLCRALVPADRETPGCDQTSELDLPGAPATLY